MSLRLSERPLGSSSAILIRLQPAIAATLRDRFYRVAVMHLAVLMMSQMNVIKLMILTHVASNVVRVRRFGTMQRALLLNMCWNILCHPMKPPWLAGVH